MTAPFGIPFYSALDRDACIENRGEDKWEVNPPAPHPSFETYTVQATQELGIVWIKSITRSFEDDRYGFGVQGLYNQLKNQLTMRYGQGEVKDFLFSDAIWTEDNEWVASIANHERIFSTVWDGQKIRLADDLKTVYLGVSASGHDSSWVVLEYESRRSDEADAALQASLSKLL